jgi:hypothetical protein
MRINVHQPCNKSKVSHKQIVNQGIYNNHVGKQKITLLTSGFANAHS